MKTILMIMMIGFVAIPALAQKDVDGKLAGSIDNLSEVKIAPGSLYAFHRFKYTTSTPEQFNGTIIAEKDSAYFLLTKGVSSNKVFAFELERRDQTLWLISNATLHTCTSGEISTDSFTFQGNKIVGCKSGEYKKLTN